MYEIPNYKDRTMALVVQKFGGTSLASVDRIKSVAQRVVAELEQGHQVVVVVSAMAGVTNQLVGWAHQCAHHQLTATEYDVVVSSGEQVTAGLMALALNDVGVKSRSWLAWQIPIHTDAAHKNASIENINTKVIQDALNQGEVAIVAGFQGISPDNRLTTIGRGGSDYTAVALAVALKAARCDIYTDVDGVFTADPRLITNARKLDHLSYQEVLDIAGHGAKVLQPQSVEEAQGGQVPIRVLSSFNANEGTLINKVSQTQDFIAVASRRDRSLISLELMGDATSTSKEIQQVLAEAFVEVDYTCKFQPEGQNLAVIVSRDDYEDALARINQYSRSTKDRVASVNAISRVSQVAIIGHLGEKAGAVGNRVRELFSLREIEIYNLRTDSRAVSVLLPAENMEESVKVLHEEFILNQKLVKDVA